MNRCIGRAFLFGAACAANQGLAQGHEARRYTSAQGIEMVQNRGALVDQSLALPPLAGGKTTNGGAVKAPPAALPTTPAHGASGARVSTADQAERDLDRLTILQRELGNEVVLLRSVTHSLATPELRSKLAADEVQRLAYLSGLHEQNIKALTAEIKRVRN
ncbi:hypothetical protein [Rhodoferax sp.]|uniref:hypothetical protein n=1 Tax=Rhodoferax sp. TaxID=50421 RepID=UPI00274F63A6|nr:hypothetical protein [Rhodoferax sp.]